MPLSITPLLEQLSIKTKTLEIVRFNITKPHPVEGDLGWAQREFVAEVERQYNSGKPVRIIVLKARQLGISTATEGLMFWWSFIHPGTNGLVLAHENVPSQELFNMTKLYWETFPYRHLYNLRYQTKQQLSWYETRSQLRIATAKNVQSGRGSTLHAVHASEVAFYPDAATLMLGLTQTIPHRHGSLVVLESTANGVGNYFYDQWQQAEAGESDYIPMFFPWWRHPEYRLTTTISSPLELDADEKQLLRIGASYENLAWRRWAIVNRAGGDLSRFMQEYPSTPEEAFITSGQPLFPHRSVVDCYDPIPGYRGMLIDTEDGSVKFVAERAGNLTIYKAPRSGDTRQDRYFISGDPSETIAGDPACIQVINRQTGEQVAVWHGRINPIHFAYEMIKLGKFYNWATLCPEVEGGGQATIATIIERNYPHIWQHQAADKVPGKGINSYGWYTNWTRKSWAIGELQRFVVDKAITIHDKLTYIQLRNYVQRDNGTWGNADAEVHDDSVMALAIGVTASRTLGPFMADAPSDSTTSVFMDLYSQQFAS